jgi:glycosyltransferase involved in cell wall biosynthesis
LSVYQENDDWHTNRGFSPQETNSSLLLLNNQKAKNSKRTSPPISVLHLISTRGLYGAERVLINLTEHYDTNYFRSITTILLDERDPAHDFISVLKKQGLSCLVIPCKKWFDLQAYKQVRKALLDQNIEILHCHEMKGRLYGLLLSKSLNIPILTTHHNWVCNKISTTFFEALDAIYIRFIDRIIPVSHTVFQTLRKIHIPASRMKVIINGLDTNIFNKDPSETNKLRHSLDIADGIKIIGMAGRISIEKGPRFFLEAAKILLKSIGNISFVIAGDGPLKDKMEEYAKSLGIKEHIAFAGFQYDIKTFYGLIDILIMPSLSEGMPMTLMEAMAMGVPAIASRVGGIPDIIDDGKNGILVNPCDSKAIAEAAHLLLSNNTLYSHISSNARLTIESQFSADRMANLYEEEYRSLLKSTSTS